MSSLLTDYVPFLLLTCVIEIPLLVYLLRPYSTWRRSVVVGFVCSGVTHPLLSFAWPLVIPPRGFAYLATGEGLVFLIEAAILWGLIFAWRRQALGTALLASFATNAASCAVGLALRAVF